MPARPPAWRARRLALRGDDHRSGDRGTFIRSLFEKPAAANRRVAQHHEAAAECRRDRRHGEPGGSLYELMITVSGDRGTSIRSLFEKPAAANIPLSCSKV